MRCVPKISYYDCAQWKGNNVDELHKLCEDTKSFISLNYGEVYLTFHYRTDSGYAEDLRINLGDYIIKKVRKDRSYFEIVSEEDFNTIYKIVNEESGE